MFILLVLAFVLGHEHKNLQFQINFNHLPKEYHCFLRSSSESIISTLVECDSRSYRDILDCTEMIRKTLNSSLSNSRDCKESAHLIADLLKGLEEETGCILFYALRSYLENKDSKEIKELFSEAGFSPEEFEDLREFIGKDIEMDKICTHRSYKIGVLFYDSIGGSSSASNQISVVVLHVSNHFYSYKNLESKIKDSTYTRGIKEHNELIPDEESSFFYNFKLLIKKIRNLYYENRDLYNCITYKIVERITEQILNSLLGKYYGEKLSYFLNIYIKLNFKHEYFISCDKHPELKYIEEIFLALLNYKKQLSSNLVIKLLEMAIMPSMFDVIEFVYYKWISTSDTDFKIQGTPNFFQEVEDALGEFYLDYIYESAKNITGEFYLAIIFDGAKNVTGEFYLANIFDGNFSDAYYIVHNGVANITEYIIKKTRNAIGKSYLDQGVQRVYNFGNQSLEYFYSFYR